MKHLHNVCVQANLWCTCSRARKVVASLTLGALAAEVINIVCIFLARSNIINASFFVVFLLIIPGAVLVINVVVAIQVRRAAIHSAANLGVQPHHQSTSAVPTIMLITTSLIYVLLNSTRGTAFFLWLWVIRSNSGIRRTVVAEKCFEVAHTVYKLIFAYNFYVYLITGKQFRSDLHKLLCRCSSSPSAPPHAYHASTPAIIAAAVDDDAEVARHVTADTAV